jgi:hypothetical protein
MLHPLNAAPKFLNHFLALEMYRDKQNKYPKKIYRFQNLKNLIFRLMLKKVFFG